MLERRYLTERIIGLAVEVPDRQTAASQGQPEALHRIIKRRPTRPSCCLLCWTWWKDERAGC